MTDEERLKILEEMRDAFRKARPDLNLPPARRGQSASAPQQAPSTQRSAPAQQAQQPSAATSQVPAKSGGQQSERSEEVQRKLQALRETGREQPSTIVGMLKKFIGRSNKR